MSAKPFLDAIAHRRTYYPLQKKSPIPDARIEEIVKHAIKHLWEITKSVLKEIVPAESFPTTENKINMFKGAYGTVMFFTDETDVRHMQETYSLYTEQFPVWATQANAMHQFAVWTALELEGMGANLQHYNPVIDEKVRAEWSLPATWSLVAQLVIGTPVGDAGEKTYRPIEGERFKVFGVEA